MLKMWRHKWGIIQLFFQVFLPILLLSPTFLWRHMADLETLCKVLQQFRSGTFGARYTCKRPFKGQENVLMSLFSMFLAPFKIYLDFGWILWPHGFMDLKRITKATICNNIFHTIKSFNRCYFEIPPSKDFEYKLTKINKILW